MRDCASRICTCHELAVKMPQMVIADGGTVNFFGDRLLRSSAMLCHLAANNAAITNIQVSPHYLANDQRDNQELCEIARQDCNMDCKHAKIWGTTACMACVGL